MKSTCLPVFNYSVIKQSADSVDIYIDGDIVDASTQEIYRDWFGDDTSVSYKSFRDQVNKLGAKTYNVYINSGGGLVTEAMAMHDFLLQLQSDGKTVNTIGQGIIASAATYILMAGKKPVMSSNSWLMIHNVSGFVYGDVNQVEQYATTMRKFNDASNEFYQKATGLSKTVIGNMMDAETWMTADEAKDKGFVKEIAGEATFKNAIQPDKWQFQNTAVLNCYNSFTNNNPINMDIKTLNETINNGFNNLLEKLGLTNKKEDAGLQAALKEFSDGITNSVKEAMPTDESITEKVTNAVKDLLKDETFTTTISNAAKDQVDEKLKNVVVTKEDFQREITNMNNAITDKLVNKTGEQPGKAEQSSKGKSNGRFANVNWQAE